jgi:hypothetical protein
MVEIPKEADAAVREGEGHDAKAPVKKVPVDQELGLGQILVRSLRVQNTDRLADNRTGEDQLDRIVYVATIFMKHYSKSI